MARATSMYSCSLTGKDLSTDHAGKTAGGANSKSQDQVGLAAAQGGHDGDGQHQVGDSQQNIHGPHNQIIGQVSIIT